VTGAARGDAGAAGGDRRPAAPSRLRDGPARKPGQRRHFRQDVRPASVAGTLVALTHHAVRTAPFAALITEKRCIVRKVLFSAVLGAAVLLAAPGTSSARPMHGGFHGGFHPGFHPPGSNGGRIFIPGHRGPFRPGFRGRFNRFDRFDRRFFVPRFDRFDRRFFVPRFGGFDRGLFVPRFDSFGGPFFLGF
jgi:hypothetical protein